MDQTDQKQQLITVSEEPWLVDFPHAERAPDRGYRIVRLHREQVGQAALSNLTVIFLHGAGPGDGEEAWDGLWRSLLQEFPLGSEVLLPSGPLLTDTWKDDGATPGWCRLSKQAEKIDDVFNPDSVTFGGIDYVAAALHKLIDAQLERGRRVVVGGFSQGGAVALHVALTYANSPPLCGAFGLSSYVPQPRKLAERGARNLPNLPVLLLHGEVDDVVSHYLCDLSLGALQRKGWTNSRSHCFPALGHKVNRSELQILRSWLLNLGSDSSASANQDHSLRSRF
jgi:phospholipase/carboxylesterase